MWASLPICLGNGEKRTQSDWNFTSLNETFSVKVQEKFLSLTCTHFQHIFFDKNSKSSLASCKLSYKSFWHEKAPIKLTVVICIRAVNTWTTFSVHKYSSHTIKRASLLFPRNWSPCSSKVWKCLLKLLCCNYLTDKGVYVLIKTVFTVKLLKKREGHCKQRPENGNPILPAQFIATKRMQWSSYVASAR